MFFGNPINYDPVTPSFHDFIAREVIQSIECYGVN